MVSFPEPYPRSTAEQVILTPPAKSPDSKISSQSSTNRIGDKEETKQPILPPSKMREQEGYNLCSIQNSAAPDRANSELPSPKSSTRNAIGRLRNLSSFFKKKNTPVILAKNTIEMENAEATLSHKENELSCSYTQPVLPTELSGEIVEAEARDVIDNSGNYTRPFSMTSPITTNGNVAYRGDNINTLRNEAYLPSWTPDEDIGKTDRNLTTILQSHSYDEPFQYLSKI